MYLSDYKEDSEKQKDGTPIYVGDAIFYVRRWGTKESLIIRKKIQHRLFGPLHKYSDEDDSLLLAHWLCEYGVSNWENVFPEKGFDEILYSIENSRDIFLNHEYFLSLNQILFKESLKFENYLYDEMEASIEEIKKQ